MAIKCSHCGKFLAAAEVVKCASCQYHRSCVNMSPGTIIPQSWNCRSCKQAPGSNKNATGETSKSMLPQTTARENNTIVEELRLLRNELQSVATIMTSFKDELARLNEKITAFNDRMNNMETRLSVLEAEKQERQQLTLSASDCNSTSELVMQLRSELDERAQEGLLNDVELTGLDERDGENLTHIVLSLAQKLGADLDERDIVSAERAGPRRIAADGSRRPRPIAVRLARRPVRDNLLRCARVRRGTDSSGITDTEPKRVYVNERLTASNKQLFYKTREECRRANWRFVWTKNGRIHIRKNESTEIRRIKSLEDLAKFFGN